MLQCIADICFRSQAFLAGKGFWAKAGAEQAPEGTSSKDLEKATPTQWDACDHGSPALKVGNECGAGVGIGRYTSYTGSDADALPGKKVHSLP